MIAELLLAASTGLLGGFGHCAGMCGPIVGSMGLVASPRIGARRALLGQLLYNAGRITTYACIGAVMGLSGSFVNVAGRLTGLQDAVSVIAGAIMIVMGLGALGIAGRLRGAEQRMVGRLLRAVGTIAEGEGSGRPYAVGLLLGFLPCGLSYSAFIGAAATGGLVQGLLFALSFALGTLPALLLIGSASAVLSPRLRGALYRAGGVAVVLVGALFVARGLGLRVGC